MSFDEEPDDPNTVYAVSYRSLAKAWRNLAEDLYSCCGEGGSEGRPMDLFHPDDWRRQVNHIKEIARLASTFNIPELFPAVGGYERKKT